MQNYKNIFVILILVLATACTKENMTTIENEANPIISDTPEIELLSLNLTTIHQFQDSIIFTISYLDGDGDLGEEDPDKMSIEVRDNRDAENLVFEYHLSPRTPSGSEIAIQGELSVILKNIILLNSDNDSESTTFSIRVKDRMDNWSNLVTSESVTILP